MSVPPTSGRADQSLPYASASQPPMTEEEVRALLESSARASLEMFRGRSSMDLGIPYVDEVIVPVPPPYDQPELLPVDDVAAEIEEVDDGQQVQQIYGGGGHHEGVIDIGAPQEIYGGGGYHEGVIDIGAPQEGGGPQIAALEVTGSEANADHRPHVPRYISCALELFLILMRLLYGYETVVYGGASTSLGFLFTIFPILKYRENKFRETNYCTFHSFSTQLANSSFHITAAVAILLVQFFAKTRARVLYLALAASCIHGVGTIMSAAANGPILLFAGRIFSGFGIGIMMQTESRISDVMGLPNYQYTPGSKLLQWAATLLGPVAANLLNLQGLKHPDTFWRLSFGAPGILSAIMALVSLLVLWRARKNDSIPDIWSQPATEGTTVTCPLFVIELARTVFTPLLDLNLYEHVLTMFFTPSDMVDHVLPVAVSLWECCWLAVSDFINYLRGVRVRWTVVCCIAAAQGLTFVLVVTRDVDRQISNQIGILAMIVQALFIVCYAHIASPSGWIEFPDRGVKAHSYLLLMTSMLVQGGIAFATPYVLCKTAAMIYGIWALLACILVAFIYGFVPDIRNETTDEMRTESLRAYRVWGWIYS